jgi:hypothetical protein
MKKLLPFSILCIALLLVFVANPSFTYAAALTSLNFGQVSYNPSVNDSFSVDVGINTSSNQITTVDFVLTFDPSLVSANSISAGPFLPNATELQPVIDNTNGKVTYSVFTRSPATGQGVLATINFTAKGAGTGSLQFDYSSTGDSNTVVYAVGNNGNAISNTGTASLSVKSSGSPYTYSQSSYGDYNYSQSSYGNGGGGGGGGGGSSSSPSGKQGDANGDGKVNITDLSILLRNFNHGGGWAQGDFNGDGRINITDLSILLRNFGH